MKPVSLHLDGYKVFGSLDLELPEGLCAIVGSNGTGKSSLVGAVEAGLFGPLARSFAGDVQHGRDVLSLLLVFDHAGETYRVRRTYAAKGRGKSALDFEVWRFDRPPFHETDTCEPEELLAWHPLTRQDMDATQAAIERVLGLTRQTFRSSSFIAQGDSGAFCEAKPADRIRLLVAALALERWQHRLDHIRREKAAVERGLAEISGRAESLAEEVARKQDLTDRLTGLIFAEDAAETARIAAQAALDAATAEWEQAQTRILARREAEQECTTAALNLRVLDEQLAQARNTSERIPDLQAEVERLGAQTAEFRRLEVLAEARRAEHAAWQQRAREYQDGQRRNRELIERADTLNGQVARLRDAETEPCPTCGQALNQETRARAIGSYRTEAQQLVKEALTVTQALVHPGDEPEPAEPISDTLRHAPTEHAAARERLTQLQAQAAKTSDPEFMRRLGDARAALQDAEQALEDAPPVPAEETRRIQAAMLTAKTEAEAQQRALTEARVEKARVEATLDRVAIAEKRLADDTEKRGELQAELDVLAVLERAYGRTGIPTLILENVALPQIEADANRYLAELGGKTQTARIEFRTQRAQKTTDTLAETLDIVIVTEEGFEQEYLGWSGGERARLALSIRLALAGLLATRRGAEVQLLVVDEPDGLDDDGKTRLIGLMRSLPQACRYLISHDELLKQSVFDSVIELPIASPVPAEPVAA